MVIQRWQSVLLLIAAVVMGCFTFMSLGQVQLPDYTCNFTTLGFDIEGIATDGGPTDILLQEHAAAENAVSYRNPIPYSRDMRRSGIRVLFLPAGFRQLVVAHHRAVPCNRGRYTGI